MNAILRPSADHAASRSASVDVRGVAVPGAPSASGWTLETSGVAKKPDSYASGPFRPGNVAHADGAPAPVTASAPSVTHSALALSQPSMASEPCTSALRRFDD